MIWPVIPNIANLMSPLSFLLILLEVCQFYSSFPKTLFVSLIFSIGFLFSISLFTSPYYFKFFAFVGGIFFLSKVLEAEAKIIGLGFLLFSDVYI